MGVTVEVSGIRKMTSQANIDKATYALANQMMADMHQFVPYKNHILRGTAHVENNGKEIVYRTPYAKAQYYGRSKFASWSVGRHPGTGPYWDLKAKGLFMSSWVRVFERGLGV